MSEQEQCTPVWHAIVGDGWRPVRIGEQTRQDDQVLLACGWVDADYGVSVPYRTDMRPRRRRETLYEILIIKDGVDYCRMKAVKPGECLMVNENGELIPVEVER